MMGVDALRAARKSDESEQEEDVTGDREATEGDDGEQMRELLPNLNVLITSADLMANLPGMRNGTYSIGDKLEDILQNGHVKEIKATLRYLFPHRRMFGGARASDVEITELQKLNLESGIPDHPFSKSLVVIWRQLLTEVAAKKFAGKEVDGVRLRFMVETMHQTITQAAGVFKESLTLESLFAFYKNLTWHEAKQIIQQEQDRLKYNLVHGGVTGLKALAKELGDMERACEERIRILSEKVPNIGGDVLESLRTEVKDKINGTSEYLLDILVKMNTFEWIPEEWGVCQCPGSRERNVTCRRRWDDVMVADERCSKLVKPEAKENCQAAGFSWEYSEWEKCEGECPGYQKRSLQCTYCGTERKHDNDCKHLVRPQIPTRSCQVCLTFFFCLICFIVLSSPFSLLTDHHRTTPTTGRQASGHRARRNAEEERKRGACNVCGVMGRRRMATVAVPRPRRRQHATLKSAARYLSPSPSLSLPTLLLLVSVPFVFPFLLCSHFDN